MATKQQRKLNVAGVQLTLNTPQPHCDAGPKGACGTHILAGFGDKNYNFPSVDALVIAALTRLSRGQVKVKTDELADQPSEKPRSKRRAAAVRVDLDKALRSESQPAGMGGAPKKRKRASLVPLLPDELTQALGPTLYHGAEGLRSVFFKGRFDAIVAERFDPLAGAVNWASQNMEKRYQPAIASLADQLAQLRALYKQALPRVLSVLAAQNEKASAYELLSAAVSSLDQELRQILYVLRIWTDAFAQLRDGMYTQLQAIVFMMESAFKLFSAGDLDACSVADKQCKHPHLDTKVFNTGNVFLARFTNTGPSTLPGAKGPNGAHVLNVQHAHKKATALMLTPDCHEFRHDVFADIRGMAEELTLAVINAIIVEYKAGRLKFTTEKTTFGSNRIPTIEVICQLIADTIGEIDADISGGVLLTGPAFVYNLIMLFCALNSPGRSILEADQEDQLLSSESEYYMDKTEEGNPRPRAEEHLPDYIRAYFDAAALDEIGFSKAARNCEAVADQAAGLPLPEYIIWVDGSEEGPRSKAVLKIAMADLKAVAPIVAKALIRTPLKSLGGLCTFDLVNWTEGRQAKVDLLVANLLAGSAEVPTDKGDFQPTYVAAAATMAYWGLAKAGRRIGPSLAMIEENALRMLDTIRQRMAQPPVSPTQADCGCPDKDATAHSQAEPKS